MGEFSILSSPSILITDYIAYANLGAAFLNAGLVTMMGMGLAWLINTRFNGYLLFAIIALLVKFGFLAGVAASALHLPMVMHVGGVHGFMNLYNNGFAGGLAMLIIIGFIKGLRPLLILDEELSG